MTEFYDSLILADLEEKIRQQNTHYSVEKKKHKALELTFRTQCGMV